MMNYLMPAMSLAQGALGIGGSLFGGSQANDDLDDIARAIRKATEKQIAAQREFYNTARDDLSPMRDLFGQVSPLMMNLTTGEQPGQRYLTQLEGYKLDLDNDPIYQAERAEMEKMLNRRFAGRGNMLSSAADDAMLRNALPLMTESYNRGYGNIMDRYNLANQMNTQQYGRALDLANMGASAVKATANAALGTGSGISNAYGNMSNALSNVGMQQSQNTADMWGSATGAGMGALNNWTLYDILSNRNTGKTQSPTSWLTAGDFYGYGPR